MGTILIIILVIVAIALLYSMATKSNRDTSIETTKPADPDNAASEEKIKHSSYKDEYVDLSEIVPITGQRAEGPMDTFTTFIAGIGRY